MKRALIFGVSGQDGAYLAKFLLEKCYEVIGTSRDVETQGFGNLKAVNVFNEVRLESLSLKDFSSIHSLIDRYRPDEIYNLSGQSSVGHSFNHPVETLESVTLATLNILEAIKKFDYKIKFYNAGSGECFGDTGGNLVSEDSAFDPRSPYAVAKCSAFWLVKNYREGYDLHCSTGHLFNHESPLRNHRFVTKKICDYVAAGNFEKKLKLGDLSIRRDWGWAPDYVEAMWLMLQQSKPDDFVIATGKVHSLEEFVAEAFKVKGLDYWDYIERDPSLLRPNEIRYGGGNSAKAREVLGWEPRTLFSEVVSKMFSPP